MNREKTFVYDIESYPNLFLLSAKNPFTEERFKFQISPIIDERNDLKEWLKYAVEDMVGFNSLFYDYPVLEVLIEKGMIARGRDVTAKLFQFGNNKINGKRTNYRKQVPFRKQIDLFKINHFDNKAKTTSLKLLQFNLRMDNIQELPYPVGTVLKEQEIYEVVRYCDNDVDATEKLFFKTLPGIELREVLSPKYNIDFTNFNDVKIGEHIFIKKIIEKAGEHLVFSKIPFEELVSLEPYYAIKKTKGVQKNLNIVYKGFQYDFGTGGIHGSISAGIYVPEEDELIIDIDVAGYYPSMSDCFQFEPEHLKGVYSQVHAEIKDERKLYPKKTPENTSMKLAGNGSYGKGGSEFSPLCDKQYVVQTCVNGQLLLCMLAETLTIELSYHKMLQINTDGMTLVIKKNQLELFREICTRWQEFTGLILEEAFYSKMVISNVNNYLAVYDYGGVKRKGLYEYELDDTLHKNFSMLVVPKVLEQYFVSNSNVQDILYNHTDYYDFFKRTKVNKTDKLFSVQTNSEGERTLEFELQRVTRYLVTGEILYDKSTKTYSQVGVGKSLIKEMPPLPKKPDEMRYTDFESGYLCTPVNTMISDDEIKKLIYYPYYEKEIYKVINSVNENLNV
jgi:hypothetical protein